MNKLFLIFGILAFVVGSSHADVMPYSYSNGREVAYFGYEKAETYSVAIFVPGKSLEGCKVTGLNVKLPEDANVTDISGWLSSTLNIKRVNGKYVNDPDICSEAATIEGDILTIAFSEPYTITEDGFYAGYTFSQEGTDRYVATVPSVGNGCFWMLASKSRIKWKDIAEETGLSSALTVMIEGDFADNAANFVVDEPQKVSAEDEVNLKAFVVNYGMNEISSLGYSYTTIQGQGTGQLFFNPSIPPILGSVAEVEVPLGNIASLGISDASLKIETVNGEPNGSMEPITDFSIETVPFIPVNRPLFEEYTGLWCSWCPRGFVALEAMKAMKGDLFVGVSYHSEDPMDVLESTPNIPSNGLPSAFVNRANEMNPGYIYDVWDNFRSNIPIASVKAFLDWSDGEDSDIKATATVRFTEDFTRADYKVGYILIADGLSNPDWRQKNSYSGKNPEDWPNMPSPWSDVFFEGADKVEGLIFNDTAIAASEYGGIEGSIPQQIEAGREYVHTYTFKIEDLKKKALKIVNDLSLLRVVAVVVDSNTGEFVNCISSPYIGKKSSSVKNVTTNSIINTEYYTLDGMRVKSPVKGIYIRIETMSDGTQKVSKFIR